VRVTYYFYVIFTPCFTTRFVTMAVMTVISVAVIFTIWLTAHHSGDF